MYKRQVVGRPIFILKVSAHIVQKSGRIDDFLIGFYPLFQGKQISQAGHSKKMLRRMAAEFSLCLVGRQLSQGLLIGRVIPDPVYALHAAHYWRTMLRKRFCSSKLFSKQPVVTMVTVLLPGFLMPRMVIHLSLIHI